MEKDNKPSLLSIYTVKLKMFLQNDLFHEENKIANIFSAKITSPS